MRFNPQARSRARYPYRRATRGYGLKATLQSFQLPRGSFERTPNGVNPPVLEGNVKPLISSGCSLVASSRPTLREFKRVSTVQRLLDDLLHPRPEAFEREVTDTNVI